MRWICQEKVNWSLTPNWIPLQDGVSVISEWEPRWAEGNEETATVR